MNAFLGRGLASLIPRRNQNEAEQIIEEIDGPETVDPEVEEAPIMSTPVAATKPISRPVAVVEESDDDPTDDDEEVAIAETAEPDAAEEDEPETLADDQAVEVADETPDTEVKQPVGVFSDFEELEEMESDPMPARPFVTPLTIDPETGMVTSVPPIAEAKFTAVPAKLQASSKKVTAKPEPVQAEEVAEAKEAEPVAKAAPFKKRIVKKPLEEPIPSPSLQRILGEEVRYVALGDVVPNPYQPRRQFADQELEELSQSLEQHGMMQPLVVIDAGDGTYQLLAGERRLRAAKMLNWNEIPVVIRSGVTGDRHRLELALTENVQRQNLNPIEEALGYQQLNEEFGMSHEEIGHRVGRSRVAITNVLRVLQLPAEIQRGLIEGRISIGHAKAILMIPDEEKQLRFYHHVLEEGLTVRKTENRARNIQRQMNLNDPLRNKDRGRPQVALKYDGPLQERYGSNVRISFSHTKNRFEVVFNAYTEDEVTELVEKLLGERELEHNVDQDVLED